jgi:dTMP kinase
MKAKGSFICVEGLDGCGKTTQTKVLVRRLRRGGFDAIYTVEPSRGRIGRFVRKYFLQSKKRGSGIVEALLFAADRFEHVETEIIPALNEGKVVVSDRYVYSSLAYQGATGLSLDWIRRLNEHAMRPDLSIFVDVDPATVIKRLKAKKSVMETLANQRKVREVYVKLAEAGELLRVDGNKPLKVVADDVLATVLKFLGKTG